MTAATRVEPLPSRDEMRSRLLDARIRFAESPTASGAAAALGRELRAVVAELEPECLGLYWPHRAEFNAPGALVGGEGLAKSRLALPFARRTPAEMHYRLWDGAAPTVVDDCGIASSTGVVVVPDVVLVPCVGFTDAGFRLGYGGGYFDRWLAAHPQVCAIGVGWSLSHLDPAEFTPQPHDFAMVLIVTEFGPVRPAG